MTDVADVKDVADVTNMADGDKRVRKRWIILTIKLIALPLIVCMGLFFIGVSAAAGSAEKPQFTILLEKDGLWQDGYGNVIDLGEPSRIESLVKNISFEMWHYGNRWEFYYAGETDDIAGMIFDSEFNSNYKVFNDLMRKYKIPYRMQMPPDVRDAVKSGKAIYITFKAGSHDGIDLDIDRLFHNEFNRSETEFRVEDDNLVIILPARFNFLYSTAQTDQVITIQEVSRIIAGAVGRPDQALLQEEPGIPAPDFGYGDIMGAIKQRQGGEPIFPGDRKGLPLPYSNGSDFLFSSDDPLAICNLRMSGNDAVPDHRFDDLTAPYRPDLTCGDISVGARGAFYDLAAVGLKFYFPLEISFFYADPINDLSLSTDNKISYAAPGTDVLLDFSVFSSFMDDELTRFEFFINDVLNASGPFTAIGNELTNGSHSFLMPDEEAIKVTLWVNRDGTRPQEHDLSNNALEWEISSVPDAITGADIELDYNVLTQEETFSLRAIPPALTLPSYPNCAWSGGPYGTLTVVNGATNIYHNFLVNGIPGNSVDISVTDESPVDLIINTKLIRDRANFRDDPIGKYYGKNWIHNTFPMARGIVTASGTLSRDYTWWYIVTITTPGGGVSTYPVSGGGTVSNSFVPIEHVQSVMVDVYNGRETLDPAPLPKFPPNAVTGDPTDPHKQARWISAPIDLAAVRPMGDKGLTGFVERTGSTPVAATPAVDGQYARLFTYQNTAEFIWNDAKSPPGMISMREFYQKDRDKSKARDYNIDGSELAVFASDLGYRSVNYPIRSGYYFNPAGQYTFDITTVTYQTSTGETEEHKDFVDSSLAGFRYESNMVYISPSRQAVSVRGQTYSRWGDSLSRTGSAYGALPDYAGITDYAGFAGYQGRLAPDTSSLLFDIVATRDSYQKDWRELYHDYRGPDQGSLTDYRIRRALEGWEESGASDRFDMYKYVEFARGDIRVYEVTETTRVIVRVNPANRKVYTHAQMKNGNYYVNAYVGDIPLDSLPSLSYNEAFQAMTLYGVRQLDRIDIRVVGSMFDDIKN